jgi:DNA repair protein RecO (recombination protein O)
MEEDQRQVHLYHLLCHTLEKLDLGQTPEAALSILFQMRFMTISGFSPNLKECSVCRIEMERMKHNRIVFDLGKGSLVCDRCVPRLSGGLNLSKGTIKQLQWIQNGALEKAARIRFTPQAMEEGLAFLEAFVPYHLGKEPRSLTFLRQIRG